MISRKIFLSILAFTILGALTMIGAGPIYAQTNITRWSGLGQIHQQKRQERLNALVKEGKLTEAQKTALLGKLEELKNKYNREDWKNLTPQQRKEQMQKETQEFKTWAQAQGIDISYLKPGMGKWGMHRFMWSMP